MGLNADAEELQLVSSLRSESWPLLVPLSALGAGYKETQITTFQLSSPSRPISHLRIDMVIIYHSYIHTSIRLSIHTNIVQKQNSQCILHTYIHTYILTYIHTCMHTCIHAYIHIYVHAYINTCIHTYIHTQGPDGGIARLRVFGRIQTAPPTSNSFWADKEIDLAAVENGGLALVWSILLYTV